MNELEQALLNLRTELERFRTLQQQAAEINYDADNLKRGYELIRNQAEEQVEQARRVMAPLEQLATQIQALSKEVSDVHFPLRLQEITASIATVTSTVQTIQSRFQDVERVFRDTTAATQAANNLAIGESQQNINHTTREYLTAVGNQIFGHVSTKHNEAITQIEASQKALLEAVSNARKGQRRVAIITFAFTFLLLLVICAALVALALKLYPKLPG